MRLFACSHCANIVHFENTACESCGWQLGYQPWATAMLALPHAHDSGSGTPRLCANAAQGACNWLVEPGSDEPYCRACRHNGVIPDLSVAANHANWLRLEEAKRRMIYSLLRWRLPLPTRRDEPGRGLVFEFLADPGGDAPHVMTGHDEGLITIALSEADDVERERRRTAMDEPYRTLLGHFRHEIGHFYWNLLIRDSDRLETCRALFGDDRQDYAEALKRHHAQGAPPDWRDNYVSAYATTHPWEDFAETWAHCMHIVDTLETAAAFGVSLRPRIAGGESLAADLPFDPYAADSFDRILGAWLPVVIAANAINRSMGVGDVYPFVVTPAVATKLAFVHDLIRRAGDSA